MGSNQTAMGVVPMSGHFAPSHPGASWQIRTQYAHRAQRLVVYDGKFMEDNIWP